MTSPFFNHALAVQRVNRAVTGRIELWRQSKSTLTI